MIQPFLFRVVKPHHINQGFGDNKVCITEEGKVVNKVPRTNEAPCPAGSRSLYKSMKGHNGLDLRAGDGQWITCPFDGKITEVVAEDKRGLGLGITSNNKYYCEETGKDEFFKVRIWHNSAHFVKLKEEVKIGQLMALVGSTGYATGPHVHLELKPVTKSGHRNLLQNNGYFGAINLEPYMSNIYAQDAPGMISKLSGLFKLLKNLGIYPSLPF